MKERLLEWLKDYLMMKSISKDGMMPSKRKVSKIMLGVTDIAMAIFKPLRKPANGWKITMTILT